MRVIEVWTDEYKNYFYKIIPGLDSKKAGDVSARIDLRKKMNCRSFKWYLKNVFPEAPIPIDYYHYGQVFL
jgi:polypeptide N-acetylgalactosaminyltransferase